MHSLPLFVRLTNRPVILLGDGETAAAKRRLLERAGAIVADETTAAALAIVAIEDDGEAEAAVARLRARGILVNAVDRPALCDFTLPAIVDRDPVLIAIGTGGASAGLAASLRQRIEALLPSRLGDLARALRGARAEMRETWPDSADRRRALANALLPGGAIDPLGPDPDVAFWLSDIPDAANADIVRFTVRSADPDDLLVREARLLAQADQIYHEASVPSAILDRARADALRVVAEMPPDRLKPGLTLWIGMAS